MDEKTPDSVIKRPGAPSLRQEQATLLQQFVREYGRQLLTMATRMVGWSYAEDVAQEAFVRLAERIERRPLPEGMALLRSPTDLRKLMCRITACRAFEHLRRRESPAGAPDDRAEIEVIDDS